MIVPELERWSCFFVGVFIEEMVLVSLVKVFSLSSVCDFVTQILLFQKDKGCGGGSPSISLFVRIGIFTERLESVNSMSPLCTSLY